MAQAHEETIKCVVKAGKDFGVEVMGDNLGYTTMVDGAKRLEDLGCDYIVHHIGYDERRGIAARGERMPSPLDDLRAVVEAVDIPVQAVGGLTIEQAVQCPEYGAPLVVLGAPLTIDADAFQNRGRRFGEFAAVDLRQGSRFQQGLITLVAAVSSPRVRGRTDRRKNHDPGGISGMGSKRFRWLEV